MHDYFVNMTEPWAFRELKAPKRKRKGRSVRGKQVENLQGTEINFGKLPLVYYMRPPDLEILGVMRLLGPIGPGEI